MSTTTSAARPPRDIIVISNSVDELGGVTTWTHMMAKEWAARGHAVHVVGIRDTDRPADLGGELPYRTTTLHTGPFPNPFHPRGLKARLDLSARAADRRRSTAVKSMTAQLNEIFAAARPGTMVIVTQIWAMEFVALADRRGLPTIGMSHESFEASRAGSRYARVKRYYGDTDAMLALTREDADLWIGDKLNQACAMPNPLPLWPRKTSPRESKVISFIGRLDDPKGVDMLLDAWSVATEQLPDWTLRMYGSGPDEEQLKAQCSRLGLDDTVAWMGQTSDVPGALRDSSVFVLSSRFEGFPFSLLEAMALAVPCVAFDCAPGVREIVRDGVDGLLVPAGQTDLLAKELVRIAQDKELRDRLGEAARVNIARYSMDEIRQRWDELFALLER